MVLFYFSPKTTPITSRTTSGYQGFPATTGALTVFGGVVIILAVASHLDIIIIPQHPFT